MTKLFLLLFSIFISLSAFSALEKKAIYSRVGADSGIIVSATESEFEIASHILGINPPASWPKNSIGCETIVCALNKQFKDDRSTKLVLEIAKEYEVYISLGQEKNEASEVKIWTYDEIVLIKEVLSEMPASFRKMSNFKYFYRNGGPMRKRGNVPAIAYPLQNGYILVADLAFDAPKNLGELSNKHDWSKLTIFHEICHQYDFRGKLDHRNRKTFSEKQEFGFYQFSWLKPYEEAKTQISYVKNTKGEFCQIIDLKKDLFLCPNDQGYITPNKMNAFSFFKHRRDSRYNDAGDFVTWYANDSVPEDFAESCAHYRYAPHVFKEIKTLPKLKKNIHGGTRFSNRYEFLKEKVFGGVEY